MYKLRYEASVEAVWDALPGDARNEFEQALSNVCLDPWNTTEAHPAAEHEQQRILVLRHSTAVLVIIEGPEGVRRVRVLELQFFG
ncbi:hypothetical protein [Streptomyces sp. MAR4 CNX-425]|uniref:hypothetical protein n=1 Tax=Streptomyces sp. MAR4 CNX-425 TaxID=3406343 RepID=UPI003B509AA4